MRKIKWRKFKISLFSTLLLIYSAPIKVLRPTTLLQSIQLSQDQSKKEFAKLPKGKRGYLQKTIKSKLLDQQLAERLGLLLTPSPHYAIQILAPQNNSYSNTSNIGGR